MAKPVLGIDLGTSNTAAAWVDDKGRVRVAAVRPDSYLLPSVVWYSAVPTDPNDDASAGHVLVGEPARQQLVEDPRNTIFGFKRFLGLRYNSPFVHRFKDRFAWQLVEGPDGLCAVKLGEHIKPLEDVAVDVLKRLLELAAVSSGFPFDECVLSVPAHFGFAQRAVLRRAAKRAGIRVKGMVNEPTAAAMYYARQKQRDGTVLIFDLGGGTFDATLMAIVSGVVKVLATGGDAFLGGADFDSRIVDHLLTNLVNERGVDIRDNAIAIQRVTVAAEGAKISLSTQEDVRLRVPCVAIKNERFVDLESRLSRKELDDMSAPLVEKCLGVCEDILKRASLGPLEVDEVVFVGGMTRMPLIKRRIGDIFVQTETQAIHPDLGVVIGAALLTQGEKTLIDVNSLAIGVTLPGGISKELVPANTPVPSVLRLPLERPTEGQPLVFGVWESSDPTSLERSLLGTVKAPAEWLTTHKGALVLEAFLGTDLEVSLFLSTGGSDKLSLEIKNAEAQRPEPELHTKLNHPGFRSIAISPEKDGRGTPAPPAAAPRPLPASAMPALVDDSVPSAKVIQVPGSPAQKLVLEDNKSDSSTGGGEAKGGEANVPQPGETIGAYLLLDVIGRGGMGRVYLAEHKALGRRVALKMLRRRVGNSPIAVERFLSEARAVNQIHHENIIEVTDFFETDNGQSCTIMEVLEGRSLAGLLHSVKTVRPERALRIGFQVASAMVAVHDAHIIHRDIKPENIFLTARGGRDDFVKLLDFGVAKLVDEEGRSLHDTGVGAAVGTRNYMSPEQLVGQNVDHRADIFSLGVVLYETLTGQLPFKSDTDRGMLFAQLEKPAAPSAVTNLKHAIPLELSALVMQCLEGEPSKRPQTMREVKGRLEAIAESMASGRAAASSDENSGKVRIPRGGLDIFAQIPTTGEHARISTAELSAESIPEAAPEDFGEVLVTDPYTPSLPTRADTRPDTRAAGKRDITAPLPGAAQSTAPGAAEALATTPRPTLPVTEPSGATIVRTGVSPAVVAVLMALAVLATLAVTSLIAR